MLEFPKWFNFGASKAVARANSSMTEAATAQGTDRIDPMRAERVGNDIVNAAAFTGAEGMADGLVNTAILAVSIASPADETAVALSGAAKVAPKIGSAGGPGAGKAFSQATQDAARAASNNTCVFCNTATIRSTKPAPNRSNIDHAIPKARNGNNSAANAQNTCQTCNLQKGTQTSAEFSTVRATRIENK